MNALMSGPFNEIAVHLSLNLRHNLIIKETSQTLYYLCVKNCSVTAFQLACHLPMQSNLGLNAATRTYVCCFNSVCKFRLTQSIRHKVAMNKDKRFITLSEPTRVVFLCKWRRQKNVHHHKVSY